MKVKELLSDESKWCQHAFALNSHGSSTYSRSQDACRWCLNGGVNYCYEPDKSVEVHAKLCSVIQKRRHRESFALHDPVQDFNDDPATTFADIRRVLELADI